jgi:hypothetical protein
MNHYLQTEKMSLTTAWQEFPKMKTHNVHISTTATLLYHHAIRHNTCNLPDMLIAALQPQPLQYRSLHITPHALKKTINLHY